MNQQNIRKAFDRTGTSGLASMMVHYSWPAFGGVLPWPHAGLDSDFASRGMPIVDRALAERYPDLDPIEILNPHRPDLPPTCHVYWVHAPALTAKPTPTPTLTPTPSVTTDPPGDEDRDRIPDGV